MSRSGYSEDYDDDYGPNPWNAIVANSIKGKRGQAFLRELADAMDAMPVKELITGELVTPAGECCTIGVVCKARGIDVSNIEINDPEEVGNAVGISRQMAAEIEFWNDEGYEYLTDAQRWVNMREWVRKNIKGEARRG